MQIIRGFGIAAFSAKRSTKKYPGQED